MSIDVWHHIIYNFNHGDEPEDPSFGLARCNNLMAYACNWLYRINER